MLECQPVLQKTMNYKMFLEHDRNRGLKLDNLKYKKMVRSMKEIGFHPAFPIWVKKVGDQFSIQAGHHRFYAAQSLNIPLYFVVADIDFPLWVEGETTNNWTMEDFLTFHVGNGNAKYIALKDFKNATGIPISLLLAIFGGETGEKSNKAEQFRRGDVQFTPMGISNANIIYDVVLELRKINSVVAKNSSFISALLKCLFLDNFNFDPYQFIKKAKTYPSLITKQVSIDGYLVMIEHIYNYRVAPANKQSIRVPAICKAQNRKSSFGKRS